ncbi:MAG: TetR/AcrR family transcriptional regulator [Bacteroidota bacterium]
MSPRTQKQFEQMRESSREVILDAAFELFAKQGYHNTSIEQIRKKAGVSKGLIYNYFGKKEDLMTGAFLRLMEEAEDFVKEVLTEENPREQLKRLIDFSLDYIERDEEQLRLLTAISLQMNDFPELKNILKARYSSLMPMFVDLFKRMEVPEPEMEAHLLAGYFDGIGMQKIVLGDALDLEWARKNLYKKFQLSE